MRGNPTKSAYSVKRVHLVNMFSIYLVAFILSMTAILSLGWAEGSTIVYEALFVCVVVTGIFFLPIHHSAKAIVFSIVPTLVAALQFLIDGPFLLGGHYLIFLSIAMITLYFSSRLILLYGIIADTVLILLTMMKTQSLFMGQYTNIGTFLALFTYVNCILVILFFLAKWGRALVDDAEKKSLQSETLLGQLGVVIDKVEAGSQHLDENVHVFSSGIENLSQGMSGINTAIQEMAKGINEQAHSISGINGRIAETTSEMRRSQELSKGATDDASHTKETVSKGNEKMSLMNGQMSIISQAVGGSLETVSELRQNIQEIDKFLQGINQIASQTNLLALNAAIEAARAGDQGKGFAVVADEVRALAEQSARTVGDISHIIEGITTSTQMLVARIQQGDNAVRSGKEIIGDVNHYFAEIENSFGHTFDALKEEAALIETVGTHFAEIHLNIENITSISEENAAAVQEIAATIEEQNGDVSNIREEARKTSRLSNELKLLVQNQ